jgi:hypothetical protein
MRKLIHGAPRAWFDSKRSVGCRCLHMYIGHLAIGFGMRAAAVKSAPRTTPSLGTCMLAALSPDLLLAPLMLAGIEHMRIAPGITAVVPFDLYDYPWSHSLVMVVVQAAVVGGAWFAVRRRAGTALLLAAGVLSHWLLDFVTHRPDMPIGLHGPYVGLGLWNSKAGTAVVEGALFAAGVALYARATEAVDGVGRWALVALVAFLLATWAPLFFAPPPPAPGAVALTNLGGWLLVGWAYWIDRHRMWA